MTGRGQAVLALAAALGLHLGAFALHPGPAGAVASGAGGAALVSLASSDGALADLVAAWGRPPVLAPAAPPPLAAPGVGPSVGETAPVAPPPVLSSPKVLPRPDLAALPSPADPAPRADLAPPSPDPAPAVIPEAPPPDTRPKARPPSATKPDTPRRAAPPPPAQAGQKARGSGEGAAAGQGGKAAAGTATATAAASAKAEWGARIRNRIERRKIYPATARGAAGTVTVRLSVDPGGRLLSVGLARSSGNAALDAAALRAVRAAAPFPAAPRGLGPKPQGFTLPMTFRR